MLSNYYSTSPEKGSETSLHSSCAANIQPYWSTIEMTGPWMNSGMQPSMLSAGMPSDGQYDNVNNNTWGQQQPIPTSAPDQSWATAYDYGSTNHHHYYHQYHTNNIQTSRDVSPEDYFGTADMSNGSSSRDPNDQPMFSPYSEVPPQIGGLGNSTDVTISPMNPPPQYPYSSTSAGAQIPGTTSMSCSPPNPMTHIPSTLPPSSSTKPSKSSKSSKSPPTSKSKPASSSSSSNKRKSSSSSTVTRTEREQFTKMHLPQEVHRIASEHISREAWRICKAEAIEMEQRRIQLLQNGSGKLEREMIQQRHDLSLIRQGVLREQGVLEDALRRVERLSSSSAKSTTGRAA